MNSLLGLILLSMKVINSQISATTCLFALYILNCWLNGHHSALVLMVEAGLLFSGKTQ